MSWLGFVSVLISVILIICNVTFYGFVLMFIGALITIPDSIIFLLERWRNDESMGAYWISKFLAIPIILLICLVYFNNL
jgi:hypothetical protein